MSDFIHSIPDAPLNWTLASEPEPNRRPNIGELWQWWRTRQAEIEEWRESVNYYRSGMQREIDMDKVNEYYERELLNKEK